MIPSDLTRRALLAGALLLAGCGRGSLDGWVVAEQPQSPGDTAGETAACRPPEGPARVDLLFVIDPSATMCDEQAALVAGFEAFVGALGGERPLDLRVAVTTTTVGEGGRGGRFNTEAAAAWPESCALRRVFPAHSDRHCQCAACAGWDAALYRQLADEGRPFPAGAPDAAAEGYYATCLATGGCDDGALWVAEPLPPGLPEYNGNGSPNGSCRLRCGAEPADAASACADALPGRAARCEAPEGDALLSGCLPAPPTAECPAAVPGVLPAFDDEGAETHGLDVFRCLAVPPSDVTREAGLEQGLRAAWEALSADGGNADQVCDPRDPSWADAALTPVQRRARCARRFLREGAALVVVFVSDEDDCSVADGKHVAAEDFGHCAWLGDADNPAYVGRVAGTDERPLVSLPAAAERLRAVAPDPRRLYAVAVTGDVLRPATDWQFQAARTLYGSAAMGGEATAAICVGANGRAGLGLRYLLLVNELGARGFFVNVCSETAFSAELEAVGLAIGADLAACAD